MRKFLWEVLVCFVCLLVYGEEACASIQRLMLGLPTARHCSSSQGKSLAPEQLQYLKVTHRSCTSECVCIPGAALAPEPLQYLQVTSRSCSSKYLSIPGAAILMQVLEHIKMTLLSCCFTSQLIPGASVLMGKFDHIKVTMLSCSFARARAFIPSDHPQLQHSTLFHPKGSPRS